MSGEEALMVLKKAIDEGAHDGRDIPPVAQSSIDLAILNLAASGVISPQTLLRVYPDIGTLRKHIVATKEVLLVTGNKEFSDKLNDFMIFQLCNLPGGDT